MDATPWPRVKICCIASPDEAALAVRYGASAVGLVSTMPSGPGIIADELIATIAERIPPGVATFLLTSRQDVAGIVEQQRRCRTNTIQIVDRLERGTYEDLREALPGVKLVQVIHISGQESFDEALRIAPRVGALLLDSGNQSLTVKELGGTGRVHDWQISRAIREAVGVPVFLAGGIRAENAAEALRQVGPFALDVCTGVRSDGRLDEAKLAALMDTVRAYGT